MQARSLRGLGLAAALAVFVVAGLVAASAGARTRLDSDWVHFATEDGNIECIASKWVGDNEPLDCAMHSSGYDPTAPEGTNYHPHWILLDHGVALKGTTPRGMGNSKPFVLRDGKTLSVGNFRCRAASSHLTCISLRSGHGFFLSQGRQRTF